VKDWPILKSPTEIKSILGLARYYRRFVQDFARIAAPLTKLLRKGEKYIWTEKCTTAFSERKANHNPNFEDIFSNGRNGDL